jgi:hypothetical protein
LNAGNPAKQPLSGERIKKHEKMRCCFSFISYFNLHTMYRTRDLPVRLFCRVQSPFLFYW